MYFLFVSDDCFTCHVALELLKKHNDTGYVQIVSVKFNQETKEFEGFIDNISKGVVPIEKVPTLYDSISNQILVGDDAIEGIINACWKD